MLMLLCLLMFRQLNHPRSPSKQEAERSAFFLVPSFSKRDITKDRSLMWPQICKENTFGIFWNKCQVSIIGNDDGRSWHQGDPQKGKQVPFLLGDFNSEMLAQADLDEPHLLPPQKRATWYFGCGLAKTWLGHQQVWIIVGSANHVGPTAFVEENWHLMVIEKMMMEIYKYIYFWSQVTVVLGTAHPEHIQTKPQTANS